MVSATERNNLAETFRAREVYRYYQPTNSTFQSASDRSLSGKHTGPQPLRAFCDTALTAFTQLIALRLETQRAVISLSDHENEYFLAESTSTLSLSDAANDAQNHKLSMGGAKVPRTASLCERTINFKPDDHQGSFPVVLISDLRQDGALNNLECVREEPYLRSYCGVALINNRGVNIGSVYTVDSRPRDSVSQEQAEFLTMMAATVMDHLENIRAKEEVTRVTRMSQGLHAFIEGDGTMAGDWARLRKYILPAGAGIGFSWQSKNVNPAAPETTATRPQHLRAISSASTHMSGSEDSYDGIQSPLQHSGAQNESRQFNFNNSPWDSSCAVAQIPLNSVFDIHNQGLGIGAPSSTAPEMRSEANFTQKITKGKAYSNDGFSTLLHSTFSRASNLIREGMEVDGAVYFDAPVGFYEGRSTLETDTRGFDDAISEVSSESGEDDEDDEGELPTIRPGPRPHALPSNHRTSAARRGAKKHENGVLSGLPELKSEVLGFSTEKLSSLKGDDASSATNFSSVDQSLLTALVRRYPQGELFVFDDNGPISPPKPTKDSSMPSDTIEMGEKSDRHRARKRAEILRLLVSFPGARQIFFVPLYDSISGCFIGSFAWSTSATRIFSVENDLSYLIAFGHSVMAEVSRLNTLSADRAKGDFISNVSHELRSPLHGILASAEFLADTTMDGFQRSLVETVDICGRTLLDTIEHVLDFSKIKKFGQNTMQPMGVVADLDVSSIIEEVLEGVYAGFEFNGLSSLGLADTTESRTHRTSTVQKRASLERKPILANEAHTIILDIDFRDWKFPTVPGTWRRLTMNLFGNALKYTPSGWIKVKLEARAIPPTVSDDVNRTMVIMTVSDSGTGMTSDFMKSKLFMPFSQEDATMPGTGLGMSMVKEIVDLSGGKIDVRSEIGKGTDIRLSLPLEDCVAKSSTITNGRKALFMEDDVLAVRRRAQGRTVTIRGFDSTTGKNELQIQGLAKLKASIMKYITEWFELKIVSHNTANAHMTDIVISDESVFLDAATPSGNELLNEGRSLLILCSNGARRGIYASRLDNDHVVEFVSKPFGPHRLARALLNCLNKEDLLISDEQKVYSEDSELSELRDQTAENYEQTHEKIAMRPRNSKPERRVIPGGPSPVIADIPSLIEFSPSAPIINITQDDLTQSTGSISSPQILRPSSVMQAPDHEFATSGIQMPSIQVSDSQELDILSPESSSTNTYEPNRENNNRESPGKWYGSSNDGLPHGKNLAQSTTTELAIIDQKRRPKMLLVEDNPVNMMLLAAYMKKNSWDFDTGANGLLALQAVQSRPEGFDVIFMDVSMPVMTGYEATTAIRKVENERRSAGFDFQPALIIALTGFSSQEDQREAFDAGVDIFMTKPVRFREVGRVLEGWKRSAFPDDPDIL